MSDAPLDAPSGPPTDDSISVFSTIKVFKDGLTSSLSPQAGADIARGWAAKVRATERTDLNGIADLLDRLAGQLAPELLGPDDLPNAAQGAMLAREGALDVKAIGETLQQLGAHTTQVASTADDLAEPLATLGGLVRTAGFALAGGSRPDEIAGVSTELSATAGDPGLRSVNSAPDKSPDASTGRPVNFAVGDVKAIPSDETPGDTPFRPQ